MCSGEQLALVTRATEVPVGQGLAIAREGQRLRAVQLLNAWFEVRFRIWVLQRDIDVDFDPAGVLDEIDQALERRDSPEVDVHSSEVGQRVAQPLRATGRKEGIDL